MKTEVIRIDEKGTGIKDVIAMTEKLGEDSGLSHKQSIHLRLMAEETLGMVRSIAGEVGAEFYIEQKDGEYRLVTDSQVDITKEKKKTLLSASTKGVNAAAKGFMGTLRDMISTALLPREEGPSGLSVGLMSLGSPGSYGTDGSYSWSMTKYAEGVKNEGTEDAKEAWDELEKSIVASIADDVSIYIKDSHVKIEITKKFG